MARGTCVGGIRPCFMVERPRTILELGSLYSLTLLLNEAPESKPHCFQLDGYCFEAAHTLQTHCLIF